MVDRMDMIRRAIRCGEIPEFREWRHLPTSELTRAERVMRFIEMLPIPEGALVGQRMYLHDFQEAFIRSVYDSKAGTRRAIYSVARKSGKSAIVAGLLLAHIIGPEAKQNSQIVSGAMSRDQASLIFNLACKMIQLSDQFAKLVKIIPSGKRLIGLPMNVEYRALAADGKTAMGLSPVLVLMDELGQVRGPRSDFIDAITTASGAHKEALTITLSTQAATDNDLLSIWIDDAEKSGDPKTVCHVYEAPKDCDLMDEEAWQYSNPALGIFRSEDDLREQMERATRMPSSESSARNLLLNQRISVVNPFVSKSVWDSCSGEPESPDGMECYAGLDLSARTDLTAFVIAAVAPDGVRHVYPYFWTPQEGLYDRAKRDRVPYDVWVQQGFLRTTPGATVDYEFVVSEIAEICEGLDLRAIAFDRWRIDVFKKEMDRMGLALPMVEMGQGYKDQAPALDSLESELLNKRIQHGSHPVLTMCAANAVVTTDPTNSRKLDKHKATGRIDGMVALAMAIGIMSKHAEDPIDIDAFLSNPLVL